MDRGRSYAAISPSASCEPRHGSKPWPGEEAMTSVLYLLGRYHLALPSTFLSLRGQSVVWSLGNCEKKGHTSRTQPELGAEVRSGEVLCKLPLTCGVGSQRSPCPLPSSKCSQGHACPVSSFACGKPDRRKKRRCSPPWRHPSPSHLAQRGRNVKWNGGRRKKFIYPGSVICCFSTHPQAQMNHDHSHRCNPSPDPECCLEKTPSSSLVIAHQRST